ncbi:cadherin-related family member 4 isoform X4 [Catharus ustulatus]|uniref:cadherin-related family member 4 isoform X4 n=1 Tax=Catharus ustulatus TaxID=91951 RepID=UPI0014086059|nr:cadherin-related family member 4 isoform X4 [Catharus ustulatus]
MGMHRHLTFLLLSLCAPGTFIKAIVLPDLPRVVTLSEDTVSGTRVAEVTVSCSNTSSSPNVTLDSIEPNHPFNSIAVSSDPIDATTFRAEVTLRAGAELNARQVNQYTLILRAACPGEDEVEKRLFVRVTAGHVLRCDTPFASAEGDVVQVLADVAPRTPLYAVLPQPLGGLTVSGNSLGDHTPTEGSSLGDSRTPGMEEWDRGSHYPPFQFRLRNHNTPLMLTRRGVVLAPDNGFDPSKDTQMFRLEIEVMDRHGHNCSGAVRVEVLPSLRPRVTFLEPHRAVTVTEGIGPLEVITQVHARGDNVRYAILAPVAPVLFTIDEVTGEIRSTRRLEVIRAHLLIRAYNVLHPDDHATATVNVTVQGTDHQAPRCVPAIFVSQVPETMSPGSILETLRCTDSTSTDGCLHYALEGPPSSLSHFCMEGPQLKVNTTLDYDSEAMAALGFQFTATIVVTVGEQPLQSTRVPVLVTVTPVNEFRPACPSGATFTVPETAAFGSVVGRVAGTDRDYPLDSLEYSLEGESGPAQPFSIDRRTGEIRVVGPLGSQQQRSYRLVVRLTDTHNDLDLRKRQSRLCDVSVRLQELQITAGSPGSRQPVTRLVCHSSPDSAVLTYSIVGGNEDGRFRLEGNTLVYLPGDRAEPHRFVLLVEVWGGSGARRRSTVVALVVHVAPRSTPVPPSTSTQHTTLQREPLVVMRIEAVWHPPAWFVAVLTVSGALLLATLGCTAWYLLCSNRAPGKLFLAKRDSLMAVLRTHATAGTISSPVRLGLGAGSEGIDLMRGSCDPQLHVGSAGQTPALADSCCGPRGGDPSFVAKTAAQGVQTDSEPPQPV